MSNLGASSSGEPTEWTWALGGGCRERSLLPNAPRPGGHGTALRSAGTRALLALTLPLVLVACTSDPPPAASEAPPATTTPIPVVAAAPEAVAAQAPTTPPVAAATPEPTAAPPEPALEVRELERFSERSIVHANVEFVIRRALTANQTPRSYATGGEPVLDANTTYAYLDVRGRNLMTRTMAQFHAEDFKLVIGGKPIAADQSMSFLSDVAGFLRADTAVDTFLAFPVPADTDLTEAIFRIGRAPQRPSDLPLTGDVPVSAYPFVQAQEGSAEGVGPVNRASFVFNVLETTFALDRPIDAAGSPTGNRANEGELFLTIQVRAEHVGGRSPDVLRDAFRLHVDGLPRAPWNVDAPTVQPGTIVDARVHFIVPSDAQELVLQVGHIAENPGTIRLSLPTLP